MDLFPSARGTEFVTYGERFLGRVAALISKNSKDRMLIAESIQREKLSALKTTTFTKFFPMSSSGTLTFGLAAQKGQNSLRVKVKQ